MSWPESRNAIRNLAVGGFAGALAAAGGLVVVLSILGVGLFLMPFPSIDGLIVAFVVSVAFVLLASLLGAAAGLLVAIFDLLIGGRMHDGRMAYWVWLPIGVALGAAGSVLIHVFPPSTGVSAYSIAFFVIIGIACGLVAGPLFGWLYGRRQKVAQP